MDYIELSRNHTLFCLKYNYIFEILRHIRSFTVEEREREKTCFRGRDGKSRAVLKKFASTHNIFKERVPEGARSRLLSSLSHYKNMLTTYSRRKIYIDSFL